MTTTAPTVRRFIIGAAITAGMIHGSMPIAHADDDQLATARDAVCGIGGTSANPFALYGAKINLEQRFGLSDAQATSLMWQAINQYCPLGAPAPPR
jgi:hypothetical protein